MKAAMMMRNMLRMLYQLIILIKKYGIFLLHCKWNYIDYILHQLFLYLNYYNRLLIYSAIVLPYKLAFVDEDSTDQKAFDTSTDCIFFIDMVLSFFSAYYDSDENLVKNLKKIAINYLKSWFIVDIGSCVPLSFVSFQSVKDFTGILRVTKIPKLYRLVKLTK